MRLRSIGFGCLLALLGACSSPPANPNADAGSSQPPTELDRSAYTPAASSTTGGDDEQTGPAAPIGGTITYVAPDGDDRAAGTTPATALRTVSEAWNRIPQGADLTAAVTIALAPGRYPAEALPNYWESRHGTAAAPISLTSAAALQGAADRSAVVLGGGMNVFDTAHLSVSDLTIRPEPAGDAFHCERCSHLVLRNVVLDGGSRTEGAQETLKVNQSTDVLVEHSDIGGATDNAIDFVAVQGGRLLDNTVHDAEDWCGYTKGGSAYIWVEGNTFTRCGTGGFTAGQGTGFEFMTAPWITYEAMGVVVYRNVVIDTDGAGLGVNGGYDVLLAQNTLYRVGRRSHAIEVVGGSRGCDGDRAGCAARLEAGGWGATDEGGQFIPGRHVWVLDNLVVNPSDEPSPYAQLAVAGELRAPSGSGVPAGARADEDLHIAGNVFSNGVDLPFVDGDGCRTDSCRIEGLAAANLARTVALRDPAKGDVALRDPLAWDAVPLPTFDWSDAPLGVPAWPVAAPAALDVPGAG